jgi:hypothetical protein
MSWRGTMARKVYCIPVVISGAFIKHLLHNHIINIYKKIIINMKK